VWADTLAGLGYRVCILGLSDLKTDVMAAVQDKWEGKLAEVWADSLASSGLPMADVAGGLGEVFAAKDAAEVTCVKKAAFLAGSAMQKFFVQELERALAPFHDQTG